MIECYSLYRNSLIWLVCISRIPGFALWGLNSHSSPWQARRVSWVIRLFSTDNMDMCSYEPEDLFQKRHFKHKHKTGVGWFFGFTFCTVNSLKSKSCFWPQDHYVTNIADQLKHQKKNKSRSKVTASYQPNIMPISSLISGYNPPSICFECVCLFYLKKHFNNEPGYQVDIATFIFTPPIVIIQGILKIWNQLLRSHV